MKRLTAKREEQFIESGGLEAAIRILRVLHRKDVYR